MNVPASISALEFARREIEFFRDTSIEILPGLHVRYLSENDSRRMSVEVFKKVAMRDEPSMTQAADFALQGWGLADVAMRELVREHIEGALPLPEPLVKFSAETVSRPRRRMSGQWKSDHFLRDVAITMVVESVCEIFDMKPTARTDNPSASRVVAEALQAASIPMGHKAVESIWNRMGRHL